jgi:hypothetical protein
MLQRINKLPSLTSTDTATPSSNPPDVICEHTNIENSNSVSPNNIKHVPVTCSDLVGPNNINTFQSLVLIQSVRIMKNTLKKQVTCLPNISSFLTAGK